MGWTVIQKLLGGPDRVRALSGGVWEAPVSWWKALDNMFGRCSKNGLCVAFNMEPVSGPWGGSSAFVHQFGAHLKRRGFSVRYDLCDGVDLIVLVDPREDNRFKKFGPKAIEAYRQSHPGVRVLHRINECDQRKGTDFMDRMLADANRLADYTVFISAWLRDYHAARWFDPSKPHGPVYNGADPSVFHPYGSAAFDPSQPMRVVTHHWSANELKGFDVYRQVDELIASGQLPGFELRVIGRWPADLAWKSARTFPPAHGADLARQLRECHLYLTASRWEPCGMHHVEGAQCGLPLVYHEDGGGIVEAGLRYGVGFKDNVKKALLDARERYAALRTAVLAKMPDGDQMCLEYERAVRQALVQAPGG